MAPSIQVQPTFLQRWFSPWTLASIRTVLLLGLAVRLLLALILPPGYDEAYYQFYGLNPALSYFDHPAGVGLWSWISVQLGGSLLAIRLPCLLSYTVALTWLAGATDLWFGRRAALAAVILGSLSPLLFACGGLLLLPDSPLLLAIAALLRWLADQPQLLPVRARHSLALGTILGLMTLGKYHALLMLLGLLGFSLTRPISRQPWRTPWPWLGLVVWASVSSPLWLWNIQQQWVSFLFQGARTSAQSGFHPEGSLLFLLTQFLLVFPTVGLVLILGLAPRRQRDAMTSRRQLLRWLALPQLIVFTILAGRMQVLSSWLVPCWFLLLPLAGDWCALHDRGAWAARQRRAGWGTTLILTPLVALVALQVRWGVADPLLPPGLDTSAELMAPDSLRRALQSDPSLWQAIQKAEVIASLHYEQPGFLALALDPTVRGRLTTVSADPRGFAFWNPEATAQGRSGLIYRIRRFSGPGGAPGPGEAWPAGLGELTPAGEVTLQRGQRATMVIEFQRFGPLPAAWPRPYGPVAGDRGIQRS